MGLEKVDSVGRMEGRMDVKACFRLPQSEPAAPAVSLSDKQVNRSGWCFHRGETCCCCSESRKVELHANSAVADGELSL